ncbi:peroxisomal carnitine O-octanoyltransferase-like [Argonauta hians]
MSTTILNTISMDEKTFQNQASLPPLPCPDLRKTLHRYMESVRPHVTDIEYIRTERLVYSFAFNDGDRLHKQLEEKARTNVNWLKTWWEDLAYLETRTPCAPLINTGGVGPYYRHCWPPQAGTQIYRSSICLYYTLFFWELLKREMVRPQVNKEGEKLCMDQYRKIFSTCRIPGIQKDHLMSYFKTDVEGETPNHIVVLCRGRIFTMPITYSKDDLLTPPELEKQLQYIYDKCKDEEMGPSVGVLTAHNRTKWAEYYQELMKIDSRNGEYLEIIQESIMAVSLEEECPFDVNKLFLSAIAGSPLNKWFDKSITLICYKNGLFGSNHDHTPSDGMTTVNITHFIDSCVREIEGRWKGSRQDRPLDPPKELNFYLNDHILGGIEEAKMMYMEIANKAQCNVLDYSRYGRVFLRSHNLHPDTHVQLAIQYVYYTLIGEPPSTYETATMRKFNLGRTETIRSCTTELINWCKAMKNPDLSRKQKRNLMLLAAEKHNTLRVEAQNMAGCDRHLLGLYMLARENGEEIPAIFTDPSYAKSGGGGNFTLSTSFVGYTSSQGGTLPMVKRGYGCFYHIENNMIFMFTSSFKSRTIPNCEAFNEQLHSVLDEMKTILPSTPKAAKL